MTSNQIIPISKNQKRSEDASPVSSIKRFKEQVKGYEQTWEAYRKLYRASIAPHWFDMTVDDAQRLVATLNNFGLDNHRPSKKYMAERLALLVGSFPNAAPHSPHIYANAMLAHIAAEEPNVMVLEATCHELVETKKFVPAISEILKVMREQQKKWKKFLEIEEAIRSGRVQEMGDKLIEQLQKYEAGERKRWSPLPFGHPDSYEWNQIRMRYERAYRIMGGEHSALERGFKGLTDELEEECTRQVRAEQAEEARYRNTPHQDEYTPVDYQPQPQIDYQPEPNEEED